MTLDATGFQQVDITITRERLESMAGEIEIGAERGGRRNALECAAVQQLIRDELRTTIESLLGAGARAVSATLFAKRPGRNWLVSWHQDTSVAATPAGVPVRLKDGIPHVQPGPEILSELVAARVHIDAAGPITGGLCVAPRSHLLGLIDEKSIPAVVAELGSESTDCSVGSVLLMKPLLLHSSPPVQTETSRRVLHVLFAPSRLASYPWATNAHGG